MTMDAQFLRVDSLLSVGWDLLWSTCTPNLKSLCSATTNIWKAMQNAEIGVVWEVRGSPNVTVTIQQSPYDFLFDFSRNYASIFYDSRLIVNYLSKVANFNLPHLHIAPLLGWSHSNFTKIFAIRKLDSWGYHLRDSTFSCFDTIPACGRQTDRRRQLH